MSDLTQKGQLIAIAVDGQEDDALLLQSVTGSESVSRPFSFQLDVVTTKTDIDFSKILGQKALITLETLDAEKPRYFSGFVTRFSQTDSSDGLHHYSMEVGPWISFLSLNVDYKIFHNLTVVEIIKKIFDTSPTQQKDTVDTSKLSGSYSKIEYCVQYRESTLRFLSRLMEQAGIFFYFTQTDQGHTLHLVDDSSQCQPLSGQSEFSYLYRNSEDPTEEVILSLQGKEGVKTGAHTHSNYNFKTPSTDLKTSEPTVIHDGGNANLEIFEYPSPHTTIAEGKALSKLRMQEQEATQNLISGTSRIRGLAAGYKFTVKDHPSTGTVDRNIEYLVVEVQHLMTAGGAYTGGGGGANYSNRFTCIPSSVPYRPARVTPKPLIFGIQNAFVVGKSAAANDDDPDDQAGGDGEEIWVDKYGRVMVRFVWDRAGACSCRVRVAQPWAGQAWGAIMIPRVGQEVLVSFIDGDPDRPIITGSVYNGAYMPPYILPDYQTRSTIMTRSTPNGSPTTYNELRFEDKNGAEQVFVRAQYDQDNYVTHDSREWIGNSRSLVITKDQMESVGGDRHEQVTGKHLEKIGGDANSNITGNLNQKVGQNLSIQAGQNLYEKSGMNYAHQAGQAIHLKAGMSVVIEAGVELTLKAGSSFIDIGPAGIAISGSPLVMINSGGSAGSGCGSTPTDPSDPTAPDLADDGKSGTKRGGGNAQNTSKEITMPSTSTAATGGAPAAVAPAAPPASGPDAANPLAGAAGAAAAALSQLQQAATQGINQAAQAASQALSQAQQLAQQMIAAANQATQQAAAAAQQLANQAQQAANQAVQAAQQAEQQAQQAVNQVTQQARQTYNQAQQAAQQAAQAAQQAVGQAKAQAEQAAAQAQQLAQQAAQQAAQAVQQARQQAAQVEQQAQAAAQQAQQAAQQAEQQAQAAEKQAQQQAQQAVQQGQQAVQQAAQQGQQAAQQAAQQAQQAAQQAQQQAQQAAAQAQQAAAQAQQQAQQAAQQVQQAAAPAQQAAQQAAQGAQQAASQAINSLPKGF